MGTVLSYDDKTGLVIKSFTDGKERILYKTDAGTAAAICAGLFDDRGESKATAKYSDFDRVNMPSATAVQKAFEAAEDAV